MITVHNLSYADLIRMAQDRDSAACKDSFDYWANDSEYHRNWAGGSEADFKRRAVVGSADFGDEIRRHLGNMPTVATPPSDGWTSKPVGFLPNVPAYVSGATPNTMLTRKPVGAPEPVRVFVNAFVSWMNSNETITKRGAVVAALIESLRNHVPVELWVCGVSGVRRTSNGTVGMVKVPVDTLDFDRLAFVLADPLFLRRGMFKVKTAYFGVETSGPMYTGSEDKLLAAMGVTSRDVYLDGLSGDCNAEWAEIDATAWVAEQVAKRVA